MLPVSPIRFQTQQQSRTAPRTDNVSFGRTENVQDLAANLKVVNALIDQLEADKKAGTLFVQESGFGFFDPQYSATLSWNERNVGLTAWPAYRGMKPPKATDYHLYIQGHGQLMPRIELKVSRARTLAERLAFFPNEESLIYVNQVENMNITLDANNKDALKTIRRARQFFDTLVKEGWLNRPDNGENA